MYYFARKAQDQSPEQTLIFDHAEAPMSRYRRRQCIVTDALLNRNGFFRFDDTAVVIIVTGQPGAGDGRQGGGA